MGLFDSKEKMAAKASKEAEVLLLEGETIDMASSAVDAMIVTDKRIIFKDFKGAKNEWTSIPFNRITGVGVQLGKGLSSIRELTVSVGHRDYELKAWSEEEAIKLQKHIMNKII